MLTCVFIGAGKKSADPVCFRSTRTASLTGDGVSNGLASTIDMPPPPIFVHDNLSGRRATVPNMKITAESPDGYWRQITIYTTTDERGGQTDAPWPLRVHVAAMVGNEDIAASITNFEPNQPSTWAVVLITAAGRLIGVRMQFDAENYDGNTDRNAREPIDGIVGESWVRRLSDVVRLDIGKARMRLNAFSQPAPDLLDVADVSLTFGDGAVVDLGFDQLKMNAYDGRGQTDHFLDVLRQHTGL